MGRAGRDFSVAPKQHRTVPVHHEVISDEESPEMAFNAERKRSAVSMTGDEADDGDESGVNGGDE